jgi:hypothetical protein
MGSEQEKWTPGPWEVDETHLYHHSERDRVMRYADGRTVVGTLLADFDQYGKTHREDCHNARLAAAAPDLYEALAGMIETLRRYYADPDNEPPDRAQMNEAQAAIDKANGGGGRTEGFL